MTRSSKTLKVAQRQGQRSYCYTPWIIQGRRNGAMVPIEVSTPILAKYDVPLYGLIEYFLDYGIIGGKLISGYHQERLLLKWGLKCCKANLTGYPLNAKAQIFICLINNQLVKYGVTQESLPEGSVIINKPRQCPNKTIRWTGLRLRLFCLSIAQQF